jgi:hypothetical protein
MWLGPFGGSEVLVEFFYGTVGITVYLGKMKSTLTG